MGKLEKLGNGRLFGPYWPNYLALFAFSGIVIGVAMVLGALPFRDYIVPPAWEGMIGIWLLPPLFLAAWISMVLLIRKRDHPSRILFRFLKSRKFWLLRGLIFCSFLYPLARSFTVYKGLIPDLNPFYADNLLTRMDQALFFGVDPWRITHALFGPVPTMLIDKAYLVWFPMMMLLMAWFIFTKDRQFQLRGLYAYTLTWILLGVVAATMFASVGPCFVNLFYGDPHFDPLLSSLKNTDDRYDLTVFSFMEWLYLNRDADDFGSGISAMPSMHVAIAFLGFQAARTTSLKPLRWLAGTYFVIIWIGSVHLGWHYALDGLVSVVGVLLIWKFADYLSQPWPIEGGSPVESRLQPCGRQRASA